jgi:hypothetical protein
MIAPAAVAAPLRAALRARGGAPMPLPCIAAASPLPLAPRRAAPGATRNAGARRAACRAGAPARSAVAAASLRGIAPQPARGGAALLRAAWPALRRLGAAPAPRTPERGARGVTRAAAEDGGGQKKVRCAPSRAAAVLSRLCAPAAAALAAHPRAAHAPLCARARTQHRRGAPTAPRRR